MHGDHIDYPSHVLIDPNSQKSMFNQYSKIRGQVRWFHNDRAMKALIINKNLMMKFKYYEGKRKKKRSTGKLIKKKIVYHLSNKIKSTKTK